MKLIDINSGKELKEGDYVLTFRRKRVKLNSFTNRRVQCIDANGTTYEWFPSVINARLIKE